MSEYNEFIKISLHNHFGGRAADYELDDGINCDHPFDLSYAKRQVDEAKKYNFDLLGFTNKNRFSYSNYRELYVYANKANILLLPGAELDLCNSERNRFLHVTILFSDKSLKLDSFETNLSSSLKTNNGNFVTIDQLVDLACLDKCIIFPHGLKQAKRSSSENPEQFNEILDMHHAIPLFLDDSKTYKQKTLSLKLKDYLSEENFEYVRNEIGVVHSADREAFSKLKNVTYIWGENSFESLYYAAIIGKKRLFSSKDISNKNRYIYSIEISPREIGSLSKSTIFCSHGLNSIIGSSGAGKTLLLNLIKRCLTGENLINAASSNKCDYSDLYGDAQVVIKDQNGKIINPKEIDVFEGDNLYQTIIKTYSSDKSEVLNLLKASPNFQPLLNTIMLFNKSVSAYIMSIRKETKLLKSIDDSMRLIKEANVYLRANKVSEKVISTTFDVDWNQKLSDSKNKCEAVNSDLSLLMDNLATLKNLAIKYKLSSNKTFLSAFKSLSSLMLATIKKESYNLKNEEIRAQLYCDAYGLLSTFLEEYNKQEGVVVETINQSNKTIFEKSNYIVDCLKKMVLNQLERATPKLDESTLLNSIAINNDGKAKISNIKFNHIVKWDDAKDFLGDFWSKKAFKKKSEFKASYGERIDLFSFDSYKGFLNKIAETDETPENFFSPELDEFMTYDIEVSFEGKFVNIENLSAGQLSKVYINNLIDDEISNTGVNSIILYDQPDNNLEKPFISEVLGLKLNELKKKHQIFITTHEPLLVVNTDSNNIIEVKNEKFVGKKSVISFSNPSLVSSNSQEEAVEQIAKLMDGSKKAIELRNDIYGGMSK